MWTTEEKISIMFDELREVLLEYGFAFEKTEKPEQDAVELTEENLDRGHTRFCAGKLFFELDQLRRIINIDETAIALNFVSLVGDEHLD